MSQTWTDDVYAAGHTGGIDLQNVENNFAALKSMFSGGSAPANPVAGMPWFDSTQKVQKQRDAGDAAWIGLMHGDVSEKRPVYRDAAMDGYARDSSVTDKVIALKGGGTYTTGGATAGSFTYTGFTADAHTHTITLTALAGSGAVRYGDLDGTNISSVASANGVTHDGADRPAAAVCILIYLDL